MDADANFVCVDDKSSIKIEASEYLSNGKYISDIVIKDEIIIPETEEEDGESESTLSDTEESTNPKIEDCMVCSKYRSMFIILNNHDCQDDGKCKQCIEIVHWTHCFKLHKESHTLKEDDYLSDSTVSDYDENDGKCEICVKYQFMLTVLKCHDCLISENTNKCNRCDEISQWLVHIKEHSDTHEIKREKIEEEEIHIKDEAETVEEEEEKGEEDEKEDEEECLKDEEKMEDKEIGSDSTISDTEEVNDDFSSKCGVCSKYESMLNILRENHDCKLDQKCNGCEEISHWTSCYHQHQESHSLQSEEEVECCKIVTNQRDECKICLRLNSILVNLVQDHQCKSNQLCDICIEVSFWLSCLKTHKQDRGDVKEISLKNHRRNIEKINCDICSKLDSILSSANKEHECKYEHGKLKCDICNEISFFSICYQSHKKLHGKDSSEEKDFLSCSDCGKRFSGERMLKIHKPYCRYAPYCCDKCDRGFLNVLALKKHKLTHAFQNEASTAGKKLPSKCEKCGERFGNVQELKKHALAHRDNWKLFKCNQCPAQFRYKVFLKKHERTHTVKYPFKCKVCGSRFRWFSSIMNHSMKKCQKK